MHVYVDWALRFNFTTARLYFESSENISFKVQLIIQRIRFKGGKVELLTKNGNINRTRAGLASLHGYRWKCNTTSGPG